MQMPTESDALATIKVWIGWI